MFELQLPAFGETEYFDDQENRAAHVVLIEEAGTSAFFDYCALPEPDGMRLEKKAA